jgi:Protein of unknown function (DUF2505)
MPHTFDVLVESTASVEQVHSAFGDGDYWRARLAAFDAGTTLDALLVDADGTVTVTTTQDLRHDHVPALIAKFLPGDLKIVRTETWRPIGGGRVRGDVNVAVRGAPGSGFAEALLASAGSGSRLKFVATVKFNVPLVGGKIESYIGSQLAQQIPAIQHFTTTWIIEHA